DLSFDYNLNKDVDDIAEPESKNYRIRWSHRQDAKANPTQNFSANVNFSTSKYEQYNSYNPNEYVNNHKSSSINYSKSWPNAPFNLSLSANASQNSQTGSVNMNLPSGSFNMRQIYPFRSKSGSGKYKWYENVNFKYDLSFDNQIFTYDSILFSQETLDTMKYGFRHNIPLSVNFKIGKLITITPSMTYTGFINSGRTVMDSVVLDNENSRIREYSHHVKEPVYAQAINPSIGISIAPKFYGMFLSTKENSYVEAVRHVISPSAGFSFVPDMKKINRNYYDSLYYINEQGDREYHRLFNPFQGEVNSSPPSSSGRSGSLSLALNNNLEMKLRPKSDTSDEARKVVLIDNLRFSTGYSPWAESFKWQDVSMSANTRLFNQKLNIQLTGNFSPYAYMLDSLGRREEVFYYKTQNGINFLRPTRFSLSTGFSLKSKAGEQDGKGEEGQDEAGTGYAGDFEEYEMDFTPSGYSGQYVDFSIPWSFTVNYSWSWSRPAKVTSRSNSVNLRGDFSLTPKWKISAMTGYDIEAKKITSTKLNIHRDLHCWQMTFSVIPFGRHASYSFTIQAKASLLRDLKYEKKPNYYDNF
ncbi:MAG: putative LPS assembly protein LptD, partial [Bacteroidales bacterium]